MSDAILLGCKHSAQAFGVMRDTAGRTCALGAAAEAIGFNPMLDGEIAINRRWPMMYDEQLIKCPVPDCDFFSPFGENPILTPVQVLMHLNDNHRWTREEIAHWLREKGM